MRAEPAHLFVYGTLRKAASHSCHGLLASGARLVGQARMQGRLYEIDGYPGAVPSSKAGEQVAGELYRLLEPEAVLAALDDYEEAGKEYPAPQEYLRCRVTVTREDGTEVVAWCYLYNRPTAELQLISSGDWCR
ncbi:MAG: gamma-glutamylcyclotransferase family protein [Syntrophotaleaceae bacterium]